MQLSERVEWHLSIPVCRTLSGLRRHLTYTGLYERQRLCWYFMCDSMQELESRMWTAIKAEQENLKNLPAEEQAEHAAYRDKKSGKLFIPSECLERFRPTRMQSL